MPPDGPPVAPEQSKDGELQLVKRTCSFILLVSKTWDTAATYVYKPFTPNVHVVKIQEYTDTTLFQNRKAMVKATDACRAVSWQLDSTLSPMHALQLLQWQVPRDSLQPC